MTTSSWWFSISIHSLICFITSITLSPIKQWRAWYSGCSLLFPDEFLLACHGVARSRISKYLNFSDLVLNLRVIKDHTWFQDPVVGRCQAPEWHSICRGCGRRSLGTSWSTSGSSEVDQDQHCQSWQDCRWGSHDCQEVTGIQEELHSWCSLVSCPSSYCCHRMSSWSQRLDEAGCQEDTNKFIFVFITIWNNIYQIDRQLTAEHCTAPAGWNNLYEFLLVGTKL